MSVIAAKQEYVDYKMRNDGWSLVTPSKWENNCSEIRRLPMPPINGIRRRAVKDVDSGKTVDDVQLVSRVNSRRIHRYLKKKTNLSVEVDVDDVNELEAKDWEDQEMADLEGCA